MKKIYVLSLLVFSQIDEFDFITPNERFYRLFKVEWIEFDVTYQNTCIFISY